MAQEVEVTALLLALAITGSWLSPTELAVRAEIPASAANSFDGTVVWTLRAFRYQEGCLTFPCIVAMEQVSVPAGETATISVTIHIERPRVGYGGVTLHLSDGRHYEHDQEAPVPWPYLSVFHDGFESCGRRCLPDCDPPPPLCSHLVWWSSSVGYDPAVLFKDGFETGTTERWSRSVP